MLHRFCIPLRWSCLLLCIAAGNAIADQAQMAPEVSLVGADGKTQQLSALRGRLVYLDFWASWCIPCRKSFPWMNDMHRRYGDRGLVLVAVNLDAKRADADAFLSKYPAAFRVAYDADGASAKAFRVRVMPTSFLIDRDGTVLAMHQGFRDTEAATAEAEIRRALQSVGISASIPASIPAEIPAAISIGMSAEPNIESIADGG